MGEDVGDLGCRRGRVPTGLVAAGVLVEEVEEEDDDWREILVLSMADGGREEKSLGRRSPGSSDTM